MVIFSVFFSFLDYGEILASQQKGEEIRASEQQEVEVITLGRHRKAEVVQVRGFELGGIERQKWCNLGGYELGTGRRSGAKQGAMSWEGTRDNGEAIWG